MYDPAIGKWHVPDPLAEYAYNISPYNYVKNNPLLYIDLFGLSDTTYIAPEPIPEVVVTYTSPSKPTSPNFLSILYEIDRLLEGNHNPSKIREASRFEEWCIRNFDMSEVKRLGEIFGDVRAEGTNNNKVRTSESYQGRTEDEKIKKENTGTGEETDGSGRPIGVIVKIWNTRNGKTPWSDGFERDTTLTKEAYDSLKPVMPYHDVFRIERDKK